MRHWAPISTSTTSPSPILRAAASAEPMWMWRRAAMSPEVSRGPAGPRRITRGASKVAGHAHRDLDAQRESVREAYLHLVGAAARTEDTDALDASPGSHEIDRFRSSPHPRLRGVALFPEAIAHAEERFSGFLREVGVTGRDCHRSAVQRRCHEDSPEGGSYKAENSRSQAAPRDLPISRSASATDRLAAASSFIHGLLESVPRASLGIAATSDGTARSHGFSIPEKAYRFTRIGWIHFCAIAESGLAHARIQGPAKAS